MAISCAKCGTRVGVIGACPTCKRREKEAHKQASEGRETP